MEPVKAGARGQFAFQDGSFEAVMAVCRCELGRLLAANRVRRLPPPFGIEDAALRLGRLRRRGDGSDLFVNPVTPAQRLVAVRGPVHALSDVSSRRSINRFMRTLVLGLFNGYRVQLHDRTVELQSHNSIDRLTVVPGHRKKQMVIHLLDLNLSTG